MRGSEGAGGERSGEGADGGGSRPIAAAGSGEQGAQEGREGRARRWLQGRCSLLRDGPDLQASRSTPGRGRGCSCTRDSSYYTSEAPRKRTEVSGATSWAAEHRPGWRRGILGGRGRVEAGTSALGSMGAEHHGGRRGGGELHDAGSSTGAAAPGRARAGPRCMAGSGEEWPPGEGGAWTTPAVAPRCASRRRCVAVTTGRVTASSPSSSCGAGESHLLGSSDGCAGSADPEVNGSEESRRAGDGCRGRGVAYAACSAGLVDGCAAAGRARVRCWARCRGSSARPAVASWRRLEGRQAAGEGLGGAARGGELGWEEEGRPREGRMSLPGGLWGG
jgi:hypothetical protein